MELERPTPTFHHLTRRFGRVKVNFAACQIYTALIASLLIVLWTGRKPTKRTWEMLQFYFQGWASLDEVEAHLEKQKRIALKNQETNDSSDKG